MHQPQSRFINLQRGGPSAARHFSSGNNEQKPNKGDEEDYSKKFESLLGKSTVPISDAEKEEIERQKVQKAKLDAEQAVQDEIGR